LDEVTIDRQTTDLAQKCMAIAVCDQESLDHAGQLLRDIAAMEKEIREFFKPLKQKAQEAHKAIVAAEKMKLAPLETANDILRPAIRTYLEVEEQKALARDAALQKMLEDERLRLAVIASEKGMTEVSDALISAPIFVPESSAPKTEGISSRPITRYEVFDKKALIRAVADGLITDDALEVSDKYVEYLIKTRGDGASMPGIRFYKESSLVVRRSR
jgi:hypothetical protein